MGGGELQIPIFCSYSSILLRFPTSNAGLQLPRGAQSAGPEMTGTGASAGIKPGQPPVISLQLGGSTQAEDLALPYKNYCALLVLRVRKTSKEEGGCQASQAA